MIVGDGPNYKELKMLSIQLGLSSRVFFTGRIQDDQLSYLIKNSMFGIMASNREGFPTFVIECLKSGIPAIFFISTGDDIYGKVAGNFLDIRKLVDPMQLSDDINKFISRVFPVSQEMVKEWGLQTFGLKAETVETLFGINYTHTMKTDNSLIDRANAE